MRLADLVPNGDSKRFATATAATVATLKPSKPSTVARVASVTVANPPKKPNFTAKAGHGARVLYAEERAALQAYLTQINETDPALIADFWNQCQNDPAACSWWLKEVVKESAKWQQRQKAAAALQGYG